MSIIHVSKNYFSEYTCHDKVDLGIITDPFLNILSCFGNEKFIITKFSGEDTVHFSSSKDAVADFHFEMKLADIDFESLLPSGNYASFVEFDSKTLMGVLKLFHKDVSNVKLEFDNERVLFTFKSGTSVTSSTASFTSNGETCKINVAGGPISATVGQDLIKPVINGSSNFERIKIYMENDMPVFFEFTIGEDSYIHVYIAPKMEESD